jgi:RNA polymerase sigma-70 factor (sigma-E family)
VRTGTVRDDGGGALGRDADLVAFCLAIHPALVGSLTLWTGERAVAEELAQDVLVRVWQHWPAVSTHPSPRAWTLRVAYNLAMSGLRRRSAERRARGRLGVPDEIDGDASRWADGLAVRAEVAALPARQRAAVVLRFYADLSVDEVAEVIGCAPGTVKSLTHRALQSLRAELDDTELAEPGPMTGIDVDGTEGVAHGRPA